MPNPKVTLGMDFNWLPPIEGTPVQYNVAVDDPSQLQITPPGTVVVPAGTLKIALSNFLTGKPSATDYLIYVDAENAAGEKSGFLTQLFDFVAIGTPKPAPEPFTDP